VAIFRFAIAFGLQHESKVFRRGRSLGSFWYCFHASAAIVNVTYTGTVSSGFDTTGVFGPANSSLTGDPYTTAYTFDTTIGFIYSSPDINATIGGYGSATFQPSPSLGGVVTINGHSATIGGSYFGEIYGLNDGITSQTYHDVRDFFLYDPTTYDYNIMYNRIYSSSTLIPKSITTAYEYTVTGDDFAYGVVQFDHYSNPSGQLNYAIANLSPETITVSIPAVPEPATLSRFATGVSIIGLLARRKKRKAAILPRVSQELRKRHGGGGVISIGDALSEKLRRPCQFVVGDGVAGERRRDDDFVINDF
jgi:hypothetical protein